MRQSLHSRSNNDFRIKIRLVDVNADHLAVVRLSSCKAGLADRTAAGKDNFRSFSVPAVHLRLDIIICREGSAVPVLHADIREAHVLGCLLCALNISVAIADNCRHCHTAEEAELLISVFYSSVTGEITDLLFLIGEKCCVRTRVRKITCRDIDCEERCIRILCLCFFKRRSEQITRHNDDLGTILDCIVHLLDTGCIRIF